MEGEKPDAVEEHGKDGKVTAAYEIIKDTKERRVVFKVKEKEKEEVGQEIVNKAIVDDTNHQQIAPETSITTQPKDRIITSTKATKKQSPTQ